MTTISYPCPDERDSDSEREREVGGVFLPETRRCAGVVTPCRPGLP